MSMEYSPKVVLHCPSGYKMGRDSLVERFLASGVKFVGLVGQDCELVEDIIDELVVADGSCRFILTSAHLGKSVEGVLELARDISGARDGEAQLVILRG